VKNKKIRCCNCKKVLKEREIDKTRNEYKNNPLCKLCSEELYRAFNGD